MRAVVALVWLAGCRQVFGLHEILPPPQGDASSDGRTVGDGGRDGMIADAYPDAPAGFYRVGGMVTGLATPATVVLRDNGGDDLAVHANGTFQFATPLLSGLAYNATVSTQPRDQDCVVSNGTGMVAATDITSVAVACSAQLGIDCDTTICNPSTLLCCSQPSGFHCLSNQTSVCSADIPIECDDARECPGQYCCASYTGANVLTRAECSTGPGNICSAPTGGGSTYFCDPDDVTGTCPSGFTHCVPTTISRAPPGYYQCAP